MGLIHAKLPFAKQEVAPLGHSCIYTGQHHDVHYEHKAMIP